MSTLKNSTSKGYKLFKICWSFWTDKHTLVFVIENFKLNILFHLKRIMQKNNQLSDLNF